MSQRTNFILAAALGVATLVPATAMATGLYHPAPTEAGVTVHPDHVGKGRTNDQVVAELNAAMRSPAWATASRGAPWPAASAGQPRSRDDVYRETVEALRNGQIPYGETR